MPFYTFDQNSSGGGYAAPANYVIIEAASADEANVLAKGVGIYFDGVKDGWDCECCGSRWSRVFDNPYDACSSPSICGRVPEENDNFLIFYKDEDEAREQNKTFDEETKLRQVNNLGKLE